MGNNKKYGIGCLLFDLVMIWLTKGFWLIAILVWYLRTH